MGKEGREKERKEGEGEKYRVSERKGERGKKEGLG